MAAYTELATKSKAHQSVIGIYIPNTPSRTLFAAIFARFESLMERRLRTGDLSMAR
jgi:hypothetical protein